jgi:hypothetical protein
MRWVAVALVATIIAVIALLPTEKTYDDGLWPLTVIVCSTSGRPIKAVSAEACLSLEVACEQLADPPPPALTQASKSIYSAVQEPYRGAPIIVNVPNSETTASSLLWTWHRFFHYRGLLVVVELTGGKLEARAIDIPDLRHERRVAVELP